jgi:hypothetical protein
MAKRIGARREIDLLIQQATVYPSNAPTVPPLNEHCGVFEQPQLMSREDT